MIFLKRSIKAFGKLVFKKDFDNFFYNLGKSAPNTTRHTTLTGTQTWFYSDLNRIQKKKLLVLKSNISMNFNKISNNSESQEPSSISDFKISDNLKNKIDSTFLAQQFVNTLTIDERMVIKQELINKEKEDELLKANGLNITTSVINPTFGQILVVCFTSGLPFIGFGFVDNFLMIIAGDMIESYIGIFLPISTMAAAGLGNAVSDVAGIGLAHHIESACSKIIKQPKLTPEQWNKPIIGWSMVISKSFCIFLGCVIGMAPLLFINHNDEKKTEENVKSPK